MTSKQSRAGKALSRNPTPAEAAERRSRHPAHSPSRNEADATKLAHDFMGARAAVLTAVLAMEGRGVHGEIATSLRIHVLQALERIEQAVTGRVRS